MTNSSQNLTYLDRVAIPDGCDCLLLVSERGCLFPYSDSEVMAIRFNADGSESGRRLSIKQAKKLLQSWTIPSRSEQRTIALAHRLIVREK